MLRIVKNLRIINDLIELVNVYPALMRLGRILFMVLYLVHLFACVWFFVANFDQEADSWAKKEELFGKSAMFQWLVSIYWAFQTVTTVGFGDISIGMYVEYLLTIMWMLFGVSVYTLTIGTVSAIIANIDSKNYFLSQKLQTL